MTPRIVVDPDGMRRFATDLRSSAAEHQAIAGRLLGLGTPRMPPAMLVRTKATLIASALQLRAAAPRYELDAAQLRIRATFAQLSLMPWSIPRLGALGPLGFGALLGAGLGKGSRRDWSWVLDYAGTGGPPGVAENRVERWRKLVDEIGSNHDTLLDFARAYWGTGLLGMQYAAMGAYGSAALTAAGSAATSAAGLASSWAATGWYVAKTSATATAAAATAASTIVGIGGAISTWKAGYDQWNRDKGQGFTRGERTWRTGIAGGFAGVLTVGVGTAAAVAGAPVIAVAGITAGVGLAAVWAAPRFVDGVWWAKDKVTSSASAAKTAAANKARDVGEAAAGLANRAKDAVDAKRRLDDAKRKIDDLVRFPTPSLNLSGRFGFG